MHFFISVASQQPPKSEPTPGKIEEVVCKVGDLRNGELKEIEFGGKKVLLAKENDQFFAVGSKCTHYGAPLAKGEPQHF